MSATEKLKELKKRFTDLIRSGTHTLESAAKEVGASEATVWRWRDDDPSFKEDVAEARDYADSFRVQKVEEAMYSRLITGKASAAEMIFYLVNRAPGRWKDLRRIRTDGIDGEDEKIPLAALRAAMRAADEAEANRGRSTARN